MKRALLMIALLIAAIFLGGIIGETTATIAGLEWLGKAYSIGISTFELDLRVIVLTFGFQLQICIAEVLLILIAILSFPKLSSVFFH